MKNTSRTCGLVLLALAGVRPAPAQADARALLTRAVVIEEEERDVARAAAEYRKVVAAATDADLRAEAGVRLGAALLAMGKKDEARAVLKPIAAAGGTLGARAGALLQDQGQDDPVFVGRVRAALGMTVATPDLGAAELLFLGRGVVPYLMQAIRTGNAPPGRPPQPVVRSFLAAAVGVMCKLGGPAAAEGLRELAKHSDIVVRRTCAEAFFTSGLQADLVPAAHDFLADSDAEVRYAAARGLQHRVEPASLARLMGDGDGKVREFAFQLAGHRDRSGLNTIERAAVAAAIRTELAREVPVASLAAAVAAEGQGSAEGRALALELMRHPRAQLAAPPGWSGVSLPVNAHADDLVATAEALAARGDRDRLNLLANHQVQYAVGKWDRSVLPQALRLRRLGVHVGSEWFVRVLQADDVAAVLAELDVLPLGSGVGKWLAQQALPASSWKVIAAALQARRAGGDNEVYWLAAALLRTRADEGVPLVTTIATEMQRYLWVAQLLAEQPGPTPAMHEAMLVLLGRDFGAVDDNVRAGRNHLFVALAKSGREDAIQPLADAYALGLGLGSNSGYGIGFFQSEAGRAVPAVFAAKVVDACLATGSESAFMHARALSQDQRPEVYAALCKHALAAPSEMQTDLLRTLLTYGRVDPAAARALYLSALRSDEQGIFGIAAEIGIPGSIPDEALPLLAARAREDGHRGAIRSLGRSGDARQAPLLQELLRHRSGEVRVVAAGALAKLQGVDAIDALLPLTDDPDPRVRTAFTEVASQLLDRRFAPALLKILRDEVAENRELAQKALEAIEFFHTQTARWQRILSDANLDAGSAAEALVKQATTGKDQTIRLAAIASLGTLKVPETLPVLIQLMQDADVEIAAAARAAVAKINGQ